MADGTAGIREAADTRAAQATVRVALLTPPARGALAVVGLAGEGACRLADERFRPRQGGPLVDRPDRGIAVGIWLAKADAAGEELIVVRHASDHLEVHCHGGLAASDAVIASLTSSIPSGQPAAGRKPAGRRSSLRGHNPPGSRPVIPGRGFPLSGEPRTDARGQNEPHCTIETEAREALARAGGPQAARILCRQLYGALGAEFDRIKSLWQTGDKAAADTAT